MNRSITAREIETIFAAHGSWKAGALLLEDRWALALIDRAEKHGVAIVSVDHRSPDARGHTVHEGTGLGLVIRRADSWGHARDFVRRLVGRGLLFEIALEERRRTVGARFANRTVPFWTWSALFELLYLALLLVAAILMAKMDQSYTL
jgi:hypothetical protein